MIGFRNGAPATLVDPLRAKCPFPEELNTAAGVDNSNDACVEAVRAKSFEVCTTAQNTLLNEPVTAGKPSGVKMDEDTKLNH